MCGGRKSYEFSQQLYGILFTTLCKFTLQHNTLKLVWNLHETELRRLAPLPRSTAATT